MKLKQLQEASYAFNHPIIRWINKTIKDHEHDQEEWFERKDIKNPMRDKALLGIYQLLMQTYGETTFNEQVAPDELTKWGRMENYIDWIIPNQNRRIVVGLEFGGLRRRVRISVGTWDEDE